MLHADLIPPTLSWFQNITDAAIKYLPLNEKKLFFFKWRLLFSCKDDSGFINFREYLIGLALVSQPANSEEAMKLAFQVSVKEPKNQPFE